jgi:hypothetical protein
MLDHRLRDHASYPLAAQNLAAAVDLVRGDSRWTRTGSRCGSSPQEACCQPTGCAMLHGGFDASG